MASSTGYSATRYLDWLRGKTAMPAIANRYVALFTAVGSDDGTGFVEVSGGGYARAAPAAADWTAATGSGPSSGANANAIVFPTSTASWPGIIAWGLYDASTAGNLLWWDYMGVVNPLPFTAATGNPGLITSPAHGLASGDLVAFSTEAGGTLPASVAGLGNLLTVENPTPDTFDVGVAFTSTGNGFVRKVTSPTVTSGQIAYFDGGALVLIEG